MTKNKRNELVTEEVISAYDLVIDDEDVNEDEMDKMSIIWMGIEIARLGAVSAFVEMFKEFDTYPATKEGLIDRIHAEGTMLDADIDQHFITMAKMSYESFITINKDKSARVIIPVLKDIKNWFNVSSNYIRSPFFIAYGRSSNDMPELGKEIGLKLNSIFGTSFWNIDKGVSYSIPCNRNLFKNLTLETIDEEVENVNAMIDWIKAIHIISPKADHTQQNRKIRNVKQAKEEDYDLVEFRNQVMSLRKYTLAVEIELSPEYVQYVTQSTKPTDVELGIWLTSKIKGACLETYEPECFMHPKIISEKTKNFKKVNRLNEYQMAINSNGSPLWVPRVDDSSNFVSNLKKAGSENELGWSLSKMFNESDGKDAISNKIVFLDEVNSFLSFVNEGEIVSIEISDYVPFEAQHATSFALSSIVRTSAGMHSLDAFNYYVLRNPQVVDSLKIDLKDFQALKHPVSGQDVVMYGDFYYNSDHPKFEEELKNKLKSGVINYLKDAQTTVTRLQRNYEYEADRDSSFELPETHDWVEKYEVQNWNIGMLAPDTPIAFLRPLAILIQEVSKIVVKDAISNVESRSISQGMVGVGFAFYANKYLNRMAEVEKESKAYLDTLVLPKPTKEWKPPALAGISKTFKYLPHQGGVHQKMSKDPRYIILAVDAGGGKTLIATTKIIELIMKGSYKKPLIICPNYLISNYVADLNTLAEGKWNIIPITRTTIADHSEEKIFAMVRNAPPNTIYVTDYNFVKGSVVTVPYGTYEMTISENSNYLRDMGFDAAFLDESHIVKNASSQTTIAALKLISSMKMICLMSGTIIHGGPQDLYSQVTLLDPTVFGSWPDFLRDYAAVWKGNKITLWQPGAEKRMMERIRSRVAYIQVKKKEWASLLPKRVERFHGVSLSPQQKKLYKAILEEVLEEIYNDSAMKKRLEEASAEQEDFELEAKLNTYLARIEKFLAAPGTDPLSDALDEEDWVSPKVKKIVEIIEDHWKRKIPGKILIFTSFVPSAEEIYKYFPAHIKKKFVLYKASSKARDKAIFMNDDSIQGMIGVEQSLNTGHNFQNASRIIRVESVWNPGTLEQAESRIFRPDVKNTYGITEKYLDWVLCDQTIDVTKAARLMSKILWNTAIEELDNPIYAGLPNLSLISMNLSNIASTNDWVETLGDHLEAYKMFRECQATDFEEYAKRKDILTIPFAVPSAPMMAGSSIIADVPYIENHTLPYQEELGLKTLSEYAADNKEGPDTMDISGLWVHTEFGDGVVTRNTKSSVWVELKSGQVIKGISKTKLFVFEDQKTAARDKKSIKDRLKDMLQLPIKGISKDQIKNAKDFLNNSHIVDEDTRHELEDAVDEPVTQEKIVEERKKIKKKEKPLKPVPNVDMEANGSFSLFAVSVNDQIAIVVDDDDPDTPDESELQNLGFTFSGKYAYARISSRVVMNNLVDFVNSAKEKGNISLSGILEKEMLTIQEYWSQSKTKAKTIDVLTQSEMRNYYLMRARRAKDPKSLLLTFLIEDDELYAIVDLEKAPRGNVFIKKKVQGINWETSDGDYRAFFPTKGKAKSFIKELKRNYRINNLDDLKEELDSLTIIKRKD